MMIKKVLRSILRIKENETVADGIERHYYHFEKKILKFVTITRIHKSEKRPSVMMDVNFGGQIIKAR